MPQSKIGHIVFCAAPQNFGFYKDLLSFLGWAVWVDEETLLGVGSEQGTSLWFGPVTKPAANDYDGPGLNHLGLAVDSIADVDAAVAWLRERGVAALFETPRHRPEFSSPDETYYQVMFESPDRILFEIVYTGPLN